MKLDKLKFLFAVYIFSIFLGLTLAILLYDFYNKKDVFILAFDSAGFFVVLYLHSKSIKKYVEYKINENVKK